MTIKWVEAFLVIFDIVPFVLFKKLQVGHNMQNQNYIFMSKRIGTTTYKVKIFLNENSKETMEDKILRIITNHPLANDGRCDIMNISQMSRTA